MNYLQTIEKDLAEMLSNAPADEAVNVVAYTKAKILESYKNGTKAGFKNGIKVAYAQQKEKADKAKLQK